MGCHKGISLRSEAAQENRVVSTRGYLPNKWYSPSIQLADAQLAEVNHTFDVVSLEGNGSRSQSLHLWRLVCGFGVFVNGVIYMFKERWCA